MKRLFEKRLQLQLLFALLAAVFVGAFAVVFVSDAVRHAEGFVVTDTSRNLRNAIAELSRQYAARSANDSTWQTLPNSAQDISLRAISETVLSSYPGIEGGYFSDEEFLGYSFPTHDGGSPKIDVPEAERSEIQSVIERSRSAGYAEQIFRGHRDIVVIASIRIGKRFVWAMKRLPGQAERSRGEWDYLLVALLAAALLSAGGVLATAYALHRGVSEIKGGLANLRQDLTYELPQRRDELGALSAAINDMARTRLALEAKVRREDRLRTTGHLVARIAHEMRNPLNSIRLSLQMLAHRLSANRLKGSDFQMVIDEVDRMNRLLSDLLAFQQPRPPKVEQVSIAGLLEHCLDLISPQAASRKITVAIANRDGALTASVDRTYLTQIVMNLLLNATEASPAGSRITILAAWQLDRVEVQVCDEGPGLADELSEHLFEPFYTTKADGHGLGLAVSRELARTMGADLTYRRGARGGAVFVLSLKGSSDG